MGQGVSIEAFDPSHVRIYRNILQIQNPPTRVSMIQTCLSGQEYVASAKRAGLYSFLLQYVNAVSMGRQPTELPSVGLKAQVQTQQHQQVNQNGMGNNGEFLAQIIQSRNQPVPQNQNRNQVVTYEEAKKPSWQQITETPKQKAVNYFSSCLEVLGIQDEVALTQDSLKSAYKKAALRAHPDKGGNDQLFEAVTRAYAYLNEILLRIQGGREKGIREVEAPEKLKNERTAEAKPWEHMIAPGLLQGENTQQSRGPDYDSIAPIQLNAKNLDMSAFNRMFEKTHIPDPDTDGYGDWLKNEAAQTNAPKFSGKFNRDIFNSMFDEQSKTTAGQQQQQQMMLHPSAMALAMAPQLGTEIGRGRPETYTAAANDKFQFTDLRDAYEKQATFSGQVANVKVDNRSIEQYRASRERAPDPYSSQEMEQLTASESEIARREKERQRRKAEQDMVEQNYFNRMRQLVITNN